MTRNKPNPAGPSTGSGPLVDAARRFRRQKAFEELIERHQRLVIGTVVRMLGSNSEVEDIAQQVFVRVGKVPAAMSLERSSRHGC